MSEQTDKLLLGIKDKLTEDEYAGVNGVFSNNIIQLGVDEAFALRDNQGEIRAYKQRVRLSAVENTLVKIGAIKDKATSKWIDNYVISAQGYEVLNEATGTCVIMPKEVLVNGKRHMNPFVERDSNNGRILAVYARAVAFRFSSKGIPQVSDWSTIFDTPSYRMIDLLAKAKKLPQAFRLLPKGIDPTDDITHQDKAKDKKAKVAPGTWAKYPFDEATNLWINTSHDEALTWFSEIINREKKAIDFAQTFARRNASKHLHGLQKAPGPVWDVPILCWRPTGGNIIKWDATQYSQLQDRVGNMIAAPSDEFESKQPLIEHGLEVVEQDGYTELKESDPEDRQEGEIGPEADKTPEKVADTETDEKPPIDIPADKKKEEPTVPQEPKLTPEQDLLMKQYHQAKAMFKEEYVQACKDLDMAHGATHSPEAAELIIRQMQKNMV